MSFLIILRLLLQRRRILKVLGPEHGKRYTSIAAMIVEPAALYLSINLCFLVPFVANSPVQQTFLLILSQVQVGPVFPRRRTLNVVR